MAEIYKLENEIKDYAWGSAEMIPLLLGEPNTQKEPWAELWMGIHPGGPSKTTVRGKTVLLGEITELPFLFKFLAAGKPLSIQAHPNLSQAKEGFERENKAGIPALDPKRNYRDPNHKPEIVCALTDFTAMAGFRKPEETLELLSLAEGTENLRAALKDGYRSFLSALFGMNETERKILNDSVLASACDNHQKINTEKKLLIKLCGELAQSYPCDPGIISPLYLNVINLKPFEALFLPAGILHAYIGGFAMECMANSDNVLRGGLTPKHIDIQELLSVLSFDPFVPQILLPERTSSPGCYSYAGSCREFSLFLIQNPVMTAGPAQPPKTELDKKEMGIFAVYSGAVEISAGQNRIVLKKGESVFINRREKGESLRFSGIAGDDDFILFAALAPE